MMNGARLAALVLMVAAATLPAACAVEDVAFLSLDPSQRNQVQFAHVRTAAWRLVPCAACLPRTRPRRLPRGPAVLSFPDSPPRQVVLMYKSGDAANEQALEALLAAERAVQEAIEFGDMEGAEKIAFKKCDAYEGKNVQQMESKGIILATLPQIFVAIDGQGMEKYAREETPSAEKFTDYLITKLEPTTDEDVFPYSEELITDEYPVFVKFHEKWCSRCVAMTKAFENAASRMAGKVIFMEMECSSSDQAQEFCTKHNVDGFPTIKLMGGKLEKALFYDRDRSVQTIIEFLKEHVPEALADRLVEENGEHASDDGAAPEAKSEL